eukprot:1160240-Pelagomonas_calceolata.AAC.4
MARAGKASSFLLAWKMGGSGLCICGKHSSRLDMAATRNGDHRPPSSNMQIGARSKAFCVASMPLVMQGWRSQATILKHANRDGDHRPPSSNMQVGARSNVTCAAFTPLFICTRSQANSQRRGSPSSCGHCWLDDRPIALACPDYQGPPVPRVYSAIKFAASSCSWLEQFPVRTAFPFGSNKPMANVSSIGLRHPFQTFLSFVFQPTFCTRSSCVIFPAAPGYTLQTGCHDKLDLNHWALSHLNAHSSLLFRLSGCSTIVPSFSGCLAFLPSPWHA